MEEKSGVRSDPAASAPGATPKKMVEAMLDGWRNKYGDMPDVPEMPMNSEPAAPSTLATSGSPEVVAATTR